MDKEKRIEKGLTVSAAIRWASNYLSNSKIESPHIDAEYLLTHILGCRREDTLIHPDRMLTGAETAEFSRYLERRSRREPVQYITGEVEFYGHIFHVNRDVLIPRPETEQLVEEALKVLKGRGESEEGEDMTVVDLCTGSGCIAISIARELTYSRVFAADISEKAITVARDNAERHKVEDRVIFLEGDLFDAIEPLGLEGDIDLVISNPPYVSRAEMDGLQPEIKEHEPVEALYGGEDGLDFFRRIIEGAPFYLGKGGILMMEIGYGQAESIRGLFEDEGSFSGIEIIRDLSGIERIVKGIYSGYAGENSIG